MNRPDYVAIGFVRRTHGVRGMLHIEPLTDNPERFRSLTSVRIETDTVVITARVLEVSETGRGWLIKLEGIDDRDEAERLKGAYLSISCDELPEPERGSFYEFDLVGLDVFTAGGESLGKLVEVQRYPANDIYVVESDRGKLMLPATTEVIKRVDIDNKRMEVELLAGLEFE